MRRLEVVFGAAEALSFWVVAEIQITALHVARDLINS